MKMEQSVPKRRHKIQTLGNNPEENIQHLEHGESLKSKILIIYNIVLKLWLITAV